MPDADAIERMAIAMWQILCRRVHAFAPPPWLEAPSDAREEFREMAKAAADILTPGWRAP